LIVATLRLRRDHLPVRGLGGSFVSLSVALEPLALVLFAPELAATDDRTLSVYVNRVLQTRIEAILTLRTRRVCASEPDAPEPPGLYGSAAPE